MNLSVLYWPPCCLHNGHKNIFFLKPVSNLFLFSTSATSSSVENCPLTTRIRFLMTSSEQSTSSSPPITTGKRLGFTWQKRFITQSVSHHHPLLQEQRAEMIVVIIRPQVPSERRSRCTSAGCCGTSRARGRGQSQSGHTQWWEAAGRLVLLPVKDKVNYCFE